MFCSIIALTILIGLFLDRQMFLDHLEHEAKTFKPPGKLIKEFTRQTKATQKPTSLFSSSKAQPTKDRMVSVPALLAKLC